MPDPALSLLVDGENVVEAAVVTRRGVEACFPCSHRFLRYQELIARYSAAIMRLIDRGLLRRLLSYAIVYKPRLGQVILIPLSNQRVLVLVAPFSDKVHGEGVAEAFSQLLMEIIEGKGAPCTTESTGSTYSRIRELGDAGGIAATDPIVARLVREGFIRYAIVYSLLSHSITSSYRVPRPAYLAVGKVLELYASLRSYTGVKLYPLLIAFDPEFKLLAIPFRERIVVVGGLLRPAIHIVKAVAKVCRGSSYT